MLLFKLSGFTQFAKFYTVYGILPSLRKFTQLDRRKVLERLAPI
jgi:hypothetical protein